MPRAFVTGIGLISPAGANAGEHLASLRAGKTFIKRLSLFSFGAQDEAPPAGEIAFPVEGEPGIPRTHTLALIAAKEALAGSGPPDAVIIGSTTGGMPLTEECLRMGIKDPSAYSRHGTGTVAEYIAERLGCTGAALTVSTACSSGALAIKTALEMIRAGRASKVLAGGVDALCRLTICGFYTLQLIDPSGCRPLDKDRLGMTVGEGAGMLFIEASDTPPANAVAEIMGGGLSCDAYHATKPHPEGEGAALAMKACLKDAGIVPSKVDYINLHGTGTPDNDASEAKAILSVFGEKPPFLSSTKGLAGHPLAAAGAIEAGFACLALKHGFVPPNTGLKSLDESLGIIPVTETLDMNIGTVLSNSFGFGGNNASLIISRPAGISDAGVKEPRILKIKGISIITGAGHTEETCAAAFDGKTCAGCLDISAVAGDLPPRLVRRLGRLPQLVLASAEAAYRDSGSQIKPEAVYFGTGWGALSETNDFLKKIFETEGKYGSPTDFVGSVHNAPAGQAALMFGAKGPNVTATSGDTSFEQALLTAQLLTVSGSGTALLAGADEFHGEMTPILDASSAVLRVPSDGAAALIVTADESAAGPSLNTIFYERACEENLSKLIGLLKERQIDKRFAVFFAGIPACEKDAATKRLEKIVKETCFTGAIFEYRKLFGEFASAGAVAAAFAAACLRKGDLPQAMKTGAGLAGRGILILSLGRALSAVEITP